MHLKLINKKKYKVIYTPHCFSFIMDTKKMEEKKHIYILSVF
ncbi:hypothetical protein [Klebsiella pneumoniae IS43]|uniref:Uncharacterized protein n=1 Tax=Klebsiella pneumoniae IS43 TaxID=1432552 RepID=W1DWB8_KLEPN|nr:hypothetical protein [Klebsiella pneumoniae IS43]